MANGRAARGGPLGGERLERFLQGTCLARVAVVRPDGAPYVVPVWYHWDGEALWFVGRKRSAWCRFLQTEPRMAAVVDMEGPVTFGEERFLTPKVVVEGRADIVEQPGDGDRWVQIARSMAQRYRGEEGVRYVESTRGQQRWLIQLRPEVLRSWEGGGWARRYEE